jgi:hypothetical protein
METHVGGYGYIDGIDNHKTFEKGLSQANAPGQMFETVKKTVIYKAIQDHILVDDSLNVFPHLFLPQLAFVPFIKMDEHGCHFSEMEGNRNKAPHAVE